MDILANRTVGHQRVGDRQQFRGFPGHRAIRWMYQDGSDLAHFGVLAPQRLSARAKCLVNENHRSSKSASTNTDGKTAEPKERAFQATHGDKSGDALSKLQGKARERSNVFAELMETVKSSSLGQISAALYQVGGEYRRNM